MRIGAAFLCSLLCLSHAALYAQSEPYVSVALRIAPATGEPDGRLEGVLLGAIRLALARGPYRVTAAAGVADLADGSVLELGALYSISEGRVALRLRLRDAGGLMAPREARLELVIDPAFDQATADFVRAFMDEAYASVAARLAVPATPSPIALPSPPDDAPVIAPSNPAPAAFDTESDARPIPVARRSRILELGLGAFVPLGEAGVYFGAAPRLNVLYGGFFGSAERWRLSAAASLMGFSVEGESGKVAYNVFARLGGGLLYAFRPGARFNPWASIEAGPAFFIAGAEGFRTLAKALPYMSLGLGSALRLSEDLGLVFSLSWSLFLDYGRGSAYLLMGLDPGLAARLEL